MTTDNVLHPSAPSCLIVFTRYPEPEKTKTRLIPTLGARQAALLQKKLTERLIASYHHMAPKHISLLVTYNGGDGQAMRKWLGPAHYCEQPAGDLGHRMTHGFKTAATLGFQKMLLVGSDIPGLTSAILQQAYAFLDAGQIVIGPSTDGGFYGLGFAAGLLEELLPALFVGIKWSTPEVFVTIHQRLQRDGHQPALLPRLVDIDTPEDLEHFELNDLLNSPSS